MKYGFGLGLAISLIVFLGTATRGQKNISYSLHPPSAETGRPLAPQRNAAVAKRQAFGDFRFMDGLYAGSLPTQALNKFGIDTSSNQAFEWGLIDTAKQIERIVSVAGGVRPYTFTAPILPIVLESVGADPNRLTLDASGFLSGDYDGPVGVDIFFEVIARDAADEEIKGIYHLRGDDSGSFLFSHGTLAKAQLGLDYRTRLQTINREDSGVFALPDNIMIGGASLSSLEEMGLSLHSDGTLYGRPLVSGSLSFLARAFDEFGNLATSSSGALDQQVSIEIEDLSVTQSRVFAIKAAIHGQKIGLLDPNGKVVGTSSNGDDRLWFQGRLDMRSLLLADLAGEPFELRVAGGPQETGRAHGIRAFGTFDGNGRVKVIKTNETPFNLDVRLSSIGALSVKATGLDLLDALDGAEIVEGDEANVIWSFRIGQLSAAEVISIPAQVTKGAYTLRYDFKRKEGRPLAGIFQALFVRGEVGLTAPNDPIKPRDGTAYFVAFTAVPRLGINEAADLETASTATLRLGDGTSSYEETDVPLTLVENRLRFRRDLKSESKLEALVLQTRFFEHTLQTLRIPSLETGIPTVNEAVETGQTSQLWVFALDLGSGFMGETESVLFPLSVTYSSRP